MGVDKKLNAVVPNKRKYPSREIMPICRPWDARTKANSETCRETVSRVGMGRHQSDVGAEGLGE